jgi:heat shock protein HslJ
MNAMTRPIGRHGTHTLRATSRGLALISLVAAVAVAGCQSGDSLAGPTWQWTAQQVTNSAGQPLAPDPANYTIEFLTDGTVNVKADCNSLTGTYTVGIPVDLTINLATASMASCGDLSLDRVYLEYLGRTSSYSTDSGGLKLFFATDVGAMQFRSQAS